MTIIALLCLFSFSFSVASAVQTKQVTCGSLVKLRHVATKFRLHSHDIPYGQGSRQQSVTAFPKPDDAGSYWIVKGASDEPCNQGSPIQKKQKLRLQHNLTRRWLHSHLHQSPLSRNQEVSAFGNDDVTDTGDVWVIEWDGSKKAWDNTMQIRLRHVDTGAYLISTERRYSSPIPGQLEVCGAKKKDRMTLWETAEGIYFKWSTASAKDEL